MDAYKSNGGKERLPRYLSDTEDTGSCGDMVVVSAQKKRDEKAVQSVAKRTEGRAAAASSTGMSEPENNLEGGTSSSSSSSSWEQKNGSSAAADGNEVKEQPPPTNQKDGQDNVRSSTTCHSRGLSRSREELEEKQSALAAASKNNNSSNVGAHHHSSINNKGQRGSTTDTTKIRRGLRQNPHPATISKEKVRDRSSSSSRQSSASSSYGVVQDSSNNKLKRGLAQNVPPGQIRTKETAAAAAAGKAVGTDRRPIQTAAVSEKLRRGLAQNIPPEIGRKEAAATATGGVVAGSSEKLRRGLTGNTPPSAKRLAQTENKDGDISNRAAAYALTQEEEEEDRVDPPTAPEPVVGEMPIVPQRNRNQASTAGPGACSFGGIASEEHHNYATQAADEEAPVVQSNAAINEDIPVANLVDETEQEQLSFAQPMQSKHDRPATCAGKNKRVIGMLFGMAVILGIIIIAAVIFPETNRKGASSDANHVDGADDASSEAAGTKPTREKPHHIEEYVLSLLPEATGRGIRAALEGLIYYQNATSSFSGLSPQQLAYQWVVQDPNITSLTDHRIVQRFSLATFFFALNGPTGWIQKDNWLSYDVHECNWFKAEASSPEDSPDLSTAVFMNITSNGSIPCNGDSYEYLRLKDNDLEGSIPVELALLSNLKVLSLEDNPIGGTIPSQIGTMRHLEQVILFAAELTGVIPSQIGKMTQLKQVGLFVNQLTGQVPTEIGLLSDNLIRFSAASNLLTGVIPSEVGALTVLKWLNLGENSISGTLPTEMKYMTSMQSVSIEKNGLSGTILKGIWNITTLLDISITNNKFVGTLDALIGQLTALERLDIGSNEFSGPLPSEIGQMTNMGTLVGSKMDLSGNLPSEVGLLTGLSVLKINRNKFDGPLPSQLGELTGLKMFNLFGNGFSGSLPTEIGRLALLERLFKISSCNLTGTIPSELGLLERALTFDLADNHLTGTLPTQLGNLHGLTSLLLSENLLFGPIPSELGLLDSNTHSLKHLNTGTERNMSMISLWGNNLTGTVPGTLAELGRLKVLEIHNNSGITGRIPLNLCDLESWSDGGGISVDCELVNCTCDACICE